MTHTAVVVVSSDKRATGKVREGIASAYIRCVDTFMRHKNRPRLLCVVSGLPGFLWSRPVVVRELADTPERAPGRVRTFLLDVKEGRG